MQIVIFGATGMLGTQLVKQALYNGHNVKAFGRNVFTADLPKNDQLELVQGALFDQKQVYDAIIGTDAVICSLGGDKSGSDMTRSLGIKNIILQMQKAHVPRIIAVVEISLLNADKDTLIMDLPDFPDKFLPISREHLKAYQYLKASLLDWTMVCPPEIIDSDPTGDFITSSDYAPIPDSNKISAGDLALFMLSELNKNEFIKHKVGICNYNEPYSPITLI
jgi:putative NADH-flavin reductase